MLRNVYEPWAYIPHFTLFKEGQTKNKVKMDGHVQLLRTPLIQILGPKLLNQMLENAKNEQFVSRLV